MMPETSAVKALKDQHARDHVLWGYGSNVVTRLLCLYPK